MKKKLDKVDWEALLVAYKIGRITLEEAVGFIKHRTNPLTPKSL